MNINDIMIRDMKAECRREEAERREAEKNIDDGCSIPWGVIAMWLAVLAAALFTAFEAGIWYQSRQESLDATRELEAAHFYTAQN
jgi:hypothetical protein